MTKLSDSLGLAFIVALGGFLFQLTPEPVKRTGQPQLRVTDTSNIQLSVEGEFRSTVEKAQRDALETASHELEKKLESMNPTIEVHLTPMEASKYVVDKIPESRHFSAPIDETLHRMTLELELKPEQVRELRQEGRLHWAGWVGALLAGFFMLVAMVLKTDEWTGGYLTRTIIAVALTVAIVWLAVGYIALPGD
jgi:hypothetical protein